MLSKIDYLRIGSPLQIDTPIINQHRRFVKHSKIRYDIRPHISDSFQTDSFSSAKQDFRLKLCIIGPEPFPKSSITVNAPEI